MLKQRTLSKNILVNILLQITVICNGLIVPRLIIGSYGSDVNGMITSITQFLSYITLLESGIGGVIKAALYKPLLNKDKVALGGIVKATEQFFRKIAYIFVVYLAIMICFYDRIAKVELGWTFSASMVAILGISTLAQYFFGLTYQILLQADQKYWLTSGVQILTTWASIIATFILIKLGCSVHMVKLVTALFFVIRPLCFNIYVRKKYDIDSSTPANKDALNQRWSGFGHHIAYFVHTNTDIVLLTIFIGITEVSVYSVYLMIVTGVRSLLSALSSAVEPYFGRIIATGDKKKLRTAFVLYENIQFFLTTVVFVTTAVLIVPFVQIYMAGITDVDYIRPLFGCILVAAEGLYCLRAPYSCVIFSFGHFKQTMRGAFIEAGINIVLSLILIKPLGIVGIALGTLVAMIYRTTEYAFYISRKLECTHITAYFRKIVAVVVTGGIAFMLTSLFSIDAANYAEWCGYGILVTLVVGIVASASFLAVNYQETKSTLKIALNTLKK